MYGCLEHYRGLTTRKLSEIYTYIFCERTNGTNFIPEAGTRKQ